MLSSSSQTNPSMSDQHVQTGLPQVWPAKSYKCVSICLEGEKKRKQRRSWIKPVGNSLSCPYRECIKFSAFRACVSQRSVSASSSALNCSQVSLLGAPIKPVGRESIFAEAQKESCVALYVVCQRPPGCVLNPASPRGLSLGLSAGCSPLPTATSLQGSALRSINPDCNACLCYQSSASFLSEGVVSVTSSLQDHVKTSWSYHRAHTGNEQEDKRAVYRG